MICKLFHWDYVLKEQLTSLSIFSYFRTKPEGERETKQNGFAYPKKICVHQRNSIHQVVKKILPIWEEIITFEREHNLYSER